MGELIGFLIAMYICIYLPWKANQKEESQKRQDMYNNVNYHEAKASWLVKPQVDQPKFIMNYVVYVILPWNDSLVSSSKQAL